VDAAVEVPAVVPASAAAWAVDSVAATVWDTAVEPLAALVEDAWSRAVVPLLVGASDDDGVVAAVEVAVDEASAAAVVWTPAAAVPVAAALLVAVEVPRSTWGATACVVDGDAAWATVWDSGCDATAEEDRRSTGVTATAATDEASEPLTVVVWTTMRSLTLTAEPVENEAAPWASEVWPNDIPS
jgi:hypothetical protein